MACFCIHLCVYVFVLGSHPLLVFAWWKGRNNQTNSSNETEDFSILVILSDLLIAITTIPTFCLLAIGEEFKLVCDLQTLQVFFTHMFALLSIVLYSYSRIVNNRQIPFWKQLGCAFCGAAMILMIISIPLGFGFHYHIEPGGYYCMFDWTGKDDISLFIVPIVILFISLSILFVAYVYISIYLNVIRATSDKSKGTRKPFTVSVKSKCREPGMRNPTRNEIIIQKLKSTARKSFLIPIAFVVCWGPYTLTMIYQVVTSNYPDQSVDQAVSVLATLNPLANFYILAFLNKAYNRKLRDILGLKRNPNI